MSTASNRQDFGQLVKEIIDESESEEDSDQEIENMDTDRYNNNDEDLTSYVREFKTKVSSSHQIETTYIRSDANKTFRFPKMNDFSDSESSLRSLDNVRYYRLSDQNDSKGYSDPEKLAVVIRKAGRLLRHQLSHHLRYLVVTQQSQLASLLAARQPDH